jgi:hypothetical protein
MERKRAAPPLCSGVFQMTTFPKVAAVFAVFAFAGALPAAAEPFSIGLWGDMPYAKANDAPAIPALLADINASGIAFSIYDGYIKDGSSQCTDDIYVDAAAMFNSLSAPVIYEPGDNEWTDCHRKNNGGYDNLERLTHLRKTMFDTVETFGQRKLTVEHQGAPGEAYAENVLHSQGGAMFVGLNVPGSNNNMVTSDANCTKKSARTLAQCAADNAE